MNPEKRLDYVEAWLLEEYRSVLAVWRGKGEEHWTIKAVWYAKLQTLQKVAWQLIASDDDLSHCTEERLDAFAVHRQEVDMVDEKLSCH